MGLHVLFPRNIVMIPSVSVVPTTRMKDRGRKGGGGGGVTNELVAKGVKII